MDDFTLLQYLVNSRKVIGDVWMIPSVILFVWLIRVIHSVLIGLIPSVDKKTKKFFFVVLSSLLTLTFLLVLGKILK